MKKLSAKQVKQMLDRDEELRLIDVLPEERFREKRIPRSLNVPLGDDAFVPRVESLAGSKGARVVVYCADTSCDASAKAAKRLEAAGFDHVADFEGGIAEWEQAGYSLEGQAVSA